MKFPKILSGSLFFAALAGLAPAQAAVSASEAEALKTTLTPLGAERAGNADGSIPAWTGGLTTVDPGFKPGGRRSDPFAGEKPLFSITAQNVDQYKDKLPESQVFIFKKYPDYRIDVYPTHRTAAAPQWVYDYTFKNATTAVTENDGYSIKGAYGGTPFPIPKTGSEVMWNHILAWRGTAIHQFAQNWYVKDERPVLINRTSIDQEFPYYYPGKENEIGEFYYYVLINSLAPPVRAGEALLAKEPFDQLNVGTQAWVYITGQRRVRKLPVAAYDTPSPALAGLGNFDEVQGFAGAQDRYTWTSLGKKEFYIPYNASKTLQPKKDVEMLGPNFLNPDYVRWELHRVWVVEAKLRDGYRHTKPRRKFYFDEDSWNILLSDNWDAHDQLWTGGYMLTFAAPDMPGVERSAFGHYDFVQGAYLVINTIAEQDEQIVFIKPRAPAFYSPATLAGQGIR